MELVINKTQIIVALGESTFAHVDAIIHPTNTFLWFSSGFSEQLKQQGGDTLENEAISLGPAEMGSAIATGCGRLKCKYLIHAVAWGQDMMTDAHKVHQAVAAGLDLASERGCLRVAVPPAGADVGQFSLLRAVEATFLTIIQHCFKPTQIREVYFLASDRALESILNRMIQSALSAIPPEGEEPNHGQDQEKTCP